jgi:hypothetical protein
MNIKNKIRSNFLQDTRYKILTTIIFFLLATGYWLLNTDSFAVNMSSDSYKIQWGNINIGGGRKSSDSYTVTDTIGQNAPGLYSSTGYKVRAGFQYIYSIIPFTFTISDLTIDLGSLTPGSTATDTNQLTVSAGGAGGYQVLAFEDHPLRSEGGIDIPDTTCDTDACDETNADPWTQNDEFGFGFNINGDDTPADFVNTTYYRQFADDEADETHQSVMVGTSVTESSQATVTYKALVSATQAFGNYETGIVYIAVPAY